MTGAQGGVHRVHTDGCTGRGTHTVGRGTHRWVHREGYTQGGVQTGKGTHREGYTQLGAEGGCTEMGAEGWVHTDRYTGRGAHRQVQREYTWVAKLNGYTQGEDYIFSTVHISYLDCIFMVR